MLGFLVNELLVDLMKSIDCLGKLLLRLLILGQESILVAEINILLEYTIVEVLFEPQRSTHRLDSLNIIKF
jgi:hypothetical protein